MPIKIKDGHVWMTAEIPVFIGTTGAGSFPQPGEPMQNFHFIPYKGTSGTLVFDKANERWRTPSSMIFCQYWHEDGKLLVKSGLRTESLKPHNCGPETGINFIVDSPYDWYYTGYPPRNLRAYRLCKVNILDMLKYLENKVSLEQLENRIVKE